MPAGFGAALSLSTARCLGVSGGGVPWMISNLRIPPLYACFREGGSVLFLQFV